MLAFELLEDGPVQLKTGEGEEEDAVNVNDSPAQRIVSVAVTVGVEGAPGFVILYGPNVAPQLLLFVAVRLYTPAGWLVRSEFVPTITFDEFVQE
jgi:hypothetical protein